MQSHKILTDTQNPMLLLQDEVFVLESKLQSNRLLFNLSKYVYATIISSYSSI